jgi:hypothetical protein
VNAQPIVARTVERQDGKFFVEVVHDAADHELSGGGVRRDLDDLLPVTAVGRGRGLMEGDRDVDVAGVDAGHHGDGVVGDAHQPVVLALQGGGGRAVFVTDIELVVLNGHESVALFDRVAHFTVLRRTMHVST